jgi:hypothetical protein
VRELVAKDEDIVRQNVCPYCGAHGFILGPQAGLSTNVYCPNEQECGARFNVSPMFVEVIREPTKVLASTGPISVPMKQVSKRHFWQRRRA